MKCINLGNHLMSSEVQAPSDLDLNTINDSNDIILAGSVFQELATHILKENVRRLIPVCGLKNIK